MMRHCVTLVILILTVCESSARIHQLTLKNETRFVVHLNTFGYFANGFLDVNMSSLVLPNVKNDPNFPVGFSLSKSRVNGVLSYTVEEPADCTLSKTASKDELILFIIDTEKLSVHMKHFGDSDSVLQDKPKTEEKADGARRRREEENANTLPKTTGEEKETQPATTEKKDDKQVNNGPIEKILTLKKDGDSYKFAFHLTIGARSQGLYNLDFHNCHNLKGGGLSLYSLNVNITEKNPDGFLSASEIPLPRLYISMAAIFLTAAIIWTYTLLKYRYSVFKIHWLMAALAYTKAVSLLFHSINYHFINSEGRPIESLAIMYYITHLLKGALLFITLALIGTGFAFVKYILSDKEKKIFMIVIPLQVLANVAFIIIEETEEGSSEYALWREILFLVDLICCGAILFPVVWSIRHLQEAANTDGKAAMNLEKLKLFRHYYVMIVCYIYFTRIIAILLKVTVPFDWQWSQEFLVEISTLIFFVLTGFKFRPASNNPYLQLPQDEEDQEMDEVITESGALEGIHRVKKTSNGRERPREEPL